MRKLVAATSCLAAAATSAIVVGAILDIGWGALTAIWLAWLALPVIFTTLAVLGGHTPPVRGLVITGAIIAASAAFHVVIFDLADPFAFALLPPLTLLVLLAALVMLSLEPIPEDLSC